MKRIFFPILTVVLLWSCATEKALVFTESNTLYEDNAVIEINIPIAEGDSELAKTINTKVENHIANVLNFAEEPSEHILLKEAIKNFDENYKRFKNDFAESALVWEATFDGEITRNSEDIISLAISSYSNTGGAHGNANVTFYNFDKATSKLIDINTIISDKEAFKTLAEQYFKDNINKDDGFSYEDYFFGEGFHLPANMGFNDEGLILFYNPYEIAPYAMGITEFTIPYSELDALVELQ